MSGRGDGLRARRVARTRREIREHALRLFTEGGFDATTVADVADAAGVSSMTVFRHFPTKEDLVLTDEFDPVLAGRIAARPATEPPVRRIGRTLVESLAAGSAADRAELLARLRLALATPALRARQWDNQYRTQRAVVAALCAGSADPEWEFRVWVAAGACLAAATAAMVRWAELDGRPDPAELVERALSFLGEG